MTTQNSDTILGLPLSQRLSVALDPYASRNILQELLLDTEESVRTTLALRDDLPANIAYALAKDPSLPVRLGLARNSSTSADVLDILAVDDHLFIRLYIARHKNTDVNTLLFLVQEGCAQIASNDVAKANAARDLLRVLSKHASSVVRVRVAQNSNTPDYVLHQLTEDSDYDVLIMIARNPSSPGYVLTRLACARGNTLRYDRIRVLRAIAEHPNTPPALLTDMARDNDFLLQVAVHPSTPERAFGMLARKMSKGLCIELINNCALPAERLRWIATHKCDGKWEARRKCEVDMGNAIQECSSSIEPVYKLFRWIEYPITLKKHFRWDRELCPWFMESPIYTLDLSSMTKRYLNHNNLRTVGDLAKLSRADLKQISGIGSKRLDEVEELLDVQFGIRLEGSTRPMDDHSLQC